MSVLDDLEAEAKEEISADFHHLVGHGIGCQARLALEDRKRVGPFVALSLNAPAVCLRISLSGQVLAVFEKAFAEEMARLSGS